MDKKTEKKSFGFANFKDSIANTDKTEFSLASVSKIREVNTASAIVEGLEAGGSAVESLWPLIFAL